MEGLGLQSAWAYFEHSILARYIVNTSQSTLLESDQIRKRNKVSVITSDAVSTDGGMTIPTTRATSMIGWTSQENHP